VTPFNFTAIAGNLPAAPALMGNTVVWKPSATAKLSAQYIMAMFREAGLPDGVINLIYGDPVAITGAVLADDALAGVHFTGSTAVFEAILGETAKRRYRNYPRIVGETGGKNFTLAHPSADPAALATAVIRGGYEYQGQKCSATSRLYVPRSLWSEVRDALIATIATIEPGDVTDFSRFNGAVIDERAWRRLDAARAAASRSPTERLLVGAEPDMSRGYFVPPQLIETTDLRSTFLKTEFFGPLVTALVFDDGEYDAILDHLDRDSAYGLTGAIFAHDAEVVALSLDRLRHAAGNVYINDKSTGAVVGQLPFGGARASGTNDKAGSMWNLARWVSPRTIKESFTPPTDHRYPSMRPDG
jgi:1-pyrroline-5-carboxylate dehydrogenase